METVQGIVLELELYPVIEIEEFKDITGYEGLYKVSNMGQIKSLQRSGTLGGLLKLAILRTNIGLLSERHYYHIKLSKNGIEKDFPVHKLVAEAFCPKPSPLHIQIDHKICKGIPEDGLDNRSSNLRWVLPQQNSRNRVKPTKGYHLMPGGKYQVSLQNPKTSKLQSFGTYNIENEAANKSIEIQTKWKLEYPECY
jgi:hypothetical protein